MQSLSGRSSGLEPFQLWFKIFLNIFLIFISFLLQVNFKRTFSQLLPEPKVLFTVA